MKTIKSENVVFFDVDDTLVMHQKPENANSVIDSISVYDAVEKKYLQVWKNRAMIRLLQEEFSRGSFVIVWSRGGHAWAESIIKKLELEDCVHQVMSKPLVYFDDKPIEEWLTYRVYLGPEIKYKQ